MTIILTRVTNFFIEYVKHVEEDIVAYTTEGKQFAQHGDMQKAQLMLTKKKLAEKEVGWENIYQNFVLYFIAIHVISIVK